MAVLSLLELHEKFAKKKRGSFKLLGYSIQKSKQYPNGRISFGITKELADKAKLGAGDRVTFTYDPETKDGGIMKDSEGWKLTTYKKSTTLRVVFPLYEAMELPIITKVREPKGIYVGRKGISFSLKFD